jgi:ribosomal protein S27E
MIQSDLSFDETQCKNCGRLLYRHYGGKHTRRSLREWDGDVVFATMADVRCAYCGEISTIFYQADMLPSITTTTRRKRFARYLYIDFHFESLNLPIYG